MICGGNIGGVIGCWEQMLEVGLKERCCGLFELVVETVNSWINYITDNKTYQHKRTDDVISIQDPTNETPDPIIEDYI